MEWSLVLYMWDFYIFFSKMAYFQKLYFAEVIFTLKCYFKYMWVNCNKFQYVKITKKHIAGEVELNKKLFLVTFLKL